MAQSIRVDLSPSPTIFGSLPHLTFILFHIDRNPIGSLNFDYAFFAFGIVWIIWSYPNNRITNGLTFRG